MTDKFIADCFKFISENPVLFGSIVIGYLIFALIACEAIGNASEAPEDLK